MEVKALAKAAEKLAPVTEVLSAKSPEIFLGLGIVSVIGGTMLACRSTLKVDDILEEAKSDREKIESVSNDADEERYSEDDARKDEVIVKVRTVGKIAREYAPAVLLMGAGITCLVASHNIQQSRIAGLCVAYETLNEGYRRYRDRVIEDLGPEKDRDYRLGIKANDIVEETVDKKGNKKEKVHKRWTIGEDGLSEYAICFDESCSAFSSSPGYNKHFVLTQQAIANDLLHSRGKLFLRDVYEMLGAPRDLCDSWVARNVGWVMGLGDDYVDFGVFDPASEEKRRFVNCSENAIWLDFNVDGVIMAIA